MDDKSVLAPIVGQAGIECPMLRWLWDSTGRETVADRGTRVTHSFAHKEREEREKITSVPAT